MFLSWKKSGFAVRDLGLLENEAESGGFPQAREEAVSECVVVDAVLRSCFAFHFHFEQGESDRVEARHGQGKDLVFSIRLHFIF